MQNQISPPKIDLLPEHLIDQIKAGEVIERPGNLIKEILENSVDAKSTKIELTLRNNGLDLISLKDNGHGMRLNDLPLAFSRHATSKISRFEDLYSLHSYGFRGEALASIAAIAKVQCISFTGDSGSELRIEGGRTLFHGDRENRSSLFGTELVIQDLFFNTPARLKFIQSQQSEKQFIRKIIYSFVLSHPEIEFQLKFEDEDKDVIPVHADVKERLQFFAPKYKAQIIDTERFYEDNELRVYLIPGSFKAPVKWQYVLINDRLVLDKQLHRVLSQAMLSHMGGDDYHYVAFFNLPKGSIDVNVHPNKTIIKCLESSKMISLLTSTIRELGSKSPIVTPPGQNLSQAPTFQIGLDEVPSLLQERHAYNMEGIFSPHGINQSREEYLWVGSYFIKKMENTFWAISARRLLDVFTQQKLKTTATQIPLLVSEPYAVLGMNRESVNALIQAGLELEFLGKENLVLRSIPEWMNGFPLKEIVSLWIQGKNLEALEIQPKDWSLSTWDEMLEALPHEILLQEKIMVNLEILLKEKLK